MSYYVLCITLISFLHRYGSFKQSNIYLALYIFQKEWQWHTNVVHIQNIALVLCVRHILPYTFIHVINDFSV